MACLGVRKIPKSDTVFVCCKASAALLSVEAHLVDISCVYALWIFAVPHFVATEKGFTEKLRKAWEAWLEKRVLRRK